MLCGIEGNIEMLFMLAFRLVWMNLWAISAKSIAQKTNFWATAP